MVNSNSDPESAPGEGSPPAANSSGLATDNLTKRVGLSASLSEKHAVVDNREDSIDDGTAKPAYDHTHRKLKPRHIQLIGIGGTIGTALYVQIGKSLGKGGPGSLFLAFLIWSVLVLSIDMQSIPALLLCYCSGPNGATRSWSPSPVGGVGFTWFSIETSTKQSIKTILSYQA